MEHWIDKKAKLKEKFSILMDKDLNLIEGHKEEMLTKIQMKIGKSREELLKIIAGL